MLIKTLHIFQWYLFNYTEHCACEIRNVPWHMTWDEVIDRKSIKIIFFNRVYFASLSYLKEENWIKPFLRICFTWLIKKIVVLKKRTFVNVQYSQCFGHYIWFGQGKLSCLTKYSPWTMLILIKVIPVGWESNEFNLVLGKIHKVD